MDEINVIVVNRGRRYLYLRDTDPVTGQKVERSSGTASKREATKRAGEWQAELRSGTAGKSSRIRWDAFREAYEDHVATTLAEKSSQLVFSSFNVIERTMRPDNIRRITTAWVTTFQKRLLEQGRSPATVESHCRHLKAAMNWAKAQGWLPAVPEFPKLKRAKSSKLMKGRPITGEEFERVIDAAGRTMKSRQADSFVFLLRGLWLSGLRLGEALNLTWDEWSDGIRVDTSGEYVVLRIP